MVPRSSPRKKICPAIAKLLLSMGLTLLAASASAQEGIAIEQFEPLPDQHTNIYNVATADTLGHLVYSAGALFHVVSEPLRIIDAETGNVVAPIDDQIKGEVFGGLGLSEWFDFGVVIPFVMTQSGDTSSGGISGVDGAAMGDIRLVTRVKALPREWAGGVGIAVEGIFFVPTGDAASFNGEAFRAEPRLVLDYELDHGWPFEIAVNVGYFIRERAEFLNTIHDDLVRMSLGTSVHLGYPGLELVATVFGALPVTSDDAADDDGLTAAGDSITSPLETLAGVRYIAPFGVYASLGAGAGLTDAIGTPRYRLLATVGYVALEPPPPPEVVPVDVDGDGLFTGVDRCPEDPEDLDGFEDDDGCPDLDNDGDRIADAEDRCPVEPEDLDYFEDDDGCPEADNDGDAIADAVDRCPLDAEDFDEIEDDDGCPDTSLAVLTETRIEIQEKVFFNVDTATINEVSHPLLDDVAAVLVDNPQITKVRVDGHTDSTGEARYNKELSQKRAQAVVDYLIGQGIDAARLTAQGFGQERPVADDATRSGRATNRRVEFTLLEKNGQPLVD